MTHTSKCIVKFPAVVLSVCGVLTSAAQGQCEIAKLLDADGQEYDGFGGSVAVSGDVAIVGAASDDDLGEKAGSAFIFRFDTVTSQWTQEAKLLASDGAKRDRFGYSVTIENELAIIGAIGSDDKGLSSGAVYVFRYDGLTWVEDVKIFASDGGAYDGFGVAVDISGDRFIVSAPGDSDECPACGSAYIFRFDADRLLWTEEGKVTASDATYYVEGYDLFGWSVSISDEFAIVGKPRNTFPFPWGPGAAYIYHYDGKSWGGEVKLLPSNSDIGDMAGWSVAIDGDIAIFSALVGHSAVIGSGTAHVFRYDHDSSRWVEEAMLADLQGNTEDYFGSSVSLSGQTAIIGAKFDGDKDNGNNSGSAFIFDYDIKASKWVQQAKLLASDGEAGDLLGWSAAIDGDVAILGAPGDDDSADGAGSAYVFDVAACVCPADLDHDDSVGILDLFALLAAWGTNPGGPPDFDGDGNVGILDLLTLLANWGLCP